VVYFSTDLGPRGKKTSMASNTEPRWAPTYTACKIRETDLEDTREGGLTRYHRKWGLKKAFRGRTSSKDEKTELSNILRDRQVEWKNSDGAKPESPAAVEPRPRHPHEKKPMPKSLSRRTRKKGEKSLTVDTGQKLNTRCPNKGA